MQSDYNESVTYKIPPCKPPDSCLDYDEYDPCESSDDITEKDLAVLLKEEKLRVQESENATQQEAVEGKEKTGQNEFSEGAKVHDDALSKDRTALDKAEGKGTDEAEEQAGKKRVCKKFIKNPFFSNRLKFSSNLPLPPPSPPPQFFPPVEETTSKDRINCLKKRRKCRKSESGKRDRKDGAEGGKRGDKEESGESDDGKSGRQGADVGKELSNAWDDENKDGERLSQESLSKGGVEDGKEGRGFCSEDENRKKRCIKPSDRPPCRKKESEISISLQPRQIPAAQRDLPPTCPKDISEIEGHIKIPCKKICKKKNR